MASLVTILDRLQLPNNGEIPEAVAQFVLGIRFSDAEQARYLELADRHNNFGDLTPSELEDLEAFVEAGALLTILKARARKVFSTHQPAA